MEIKDFLLKQRWIFAKTYANKAPHEYCLRKYVNGTDDEFADAVQYIRDEGMKMNYFKSEHIYLFIDDKMYWTMGDPVERTVLINRCNIDDYNVYLNENDGKIYVSWKGKKKE